jgi:23S rRNA pseudouridine955/2504/2580 synthase
MMVEITITREDAGQRADRFIRRWLPHLSGSRMQSLFRRKEIKVAKKAILPAQTLDLGDCLRVFGLQDEEAKRVTDESGAESPLPPAQAAPLPPLLFENEALLVLNKPAGLAVHPGSGIEPGQSVIEAVWAHEAQGWGNSVFRPALVHRLDKDTSGVLLVAKTAECLRELHNDLRAGLLRKEYCALVRGIPEPSQGTLNQSLQRIDASSGAKMRVDEEEGLAAVTHYRTLEKSQEHSLLQVIIETGRMHQIRAHLAGAGHPLAGESRYAPFSDSHAERKAWGLKRHFLHAHRLLWKRSEGKPVVFTAPFPPDLTEVLKKMGMETPT